MKCIVCGIPIKGNQKKVCSNECYDERMLTLRREYKLAELENKTLEIRKLNLLVRETLGPTSRTLDSYRDLFKKQRTKLIREILYSKSSQ